MTSTLHGQAVSRGIAIGRAVVVASSRGEVRHYFITPAQVQSELLRIRSARDAVAVELQRLMAELPPGTPPELPALLEVHLMLLQDEELAQGVHHWITERLYNAEWALVTQLEAVSRQFDEMEDNYLRERKADLEQVVDRILLHMRGHTTAAAEAATQAVTAPRTDDLILIAHDLSPADMLQLRRSVFAGFVTAVGGKTSHTAIVARSMNIPAVVGVRDASHRIRQDDHIIIDSEAGTILINPDPATLDACRQRQQQQTRELQRLHRLRHTPAITLDGTRIELLANIEQPADACAAIQAGAVGVGLFRSEFLFMGRRGQLPDEHEQYLAYRAALDGMQGLPVTIRTIDIGADKPLGSDRNPRDPSHPTTLNPALGLRAIRWSLADPVMFRTQLRAILRAAAHGRINLLLPMIGQHSEIDQVRAQLHLAERELDQSCQPYGTVQLGGMIEIPAAALTVRSLLQKLDFISIGTNDLIQYTLAIDRADEAVAHLYDPLHPAVLQLVTNVIHTAHDMGKPVCICGEMAGDPAMTPLLLGLGLRSFSMHPAQIPAVKQHILHAHLNTLTPWAHAIAQADHPAHHMAHHPAPLPAPLPTYTT